MFGIRSFNSLLNSIKANKLYTLVLLLVIGMFGHYYFTFKGSPSYKKMQTKFNSLKKKMNINKKQKNTEEDILTSNEFPITLEEEVIAKMAPPVFINESTKANYEAVLSPNHNASPI
jgi:hypothetical protein